MKRIFRIPALIFGTVAVMTGATSCGGGDDEPSLECCTRTEAYDGTTFNDRICSDGSYTYSYTYDGETYTEEGTLNLDGYSWSDLKAELVSEGFSC